MKNLNGGTTGIQGEGGKCPSHPLNETQSVCQSMGLNNQNRSIRANHDPIIHITVLHFLLFGVLSPQEYFKNKNFQIYGVMHYIVSVCTVHVEQFVTYFCFNTYCDHLFLLQFITFVLRAITWNYECRPNFVQSNHDMNGSVYYEHTVLHYSPTTIVLIANFLSQFLSNIYNWQKML